MQLTRRTFLAGSSAFAMSAAAQAREYAGGVPWTPNAALPPDSYEWNKTFLTGEERVFLTAAVDRLIPEDEFPSASALGVVDFIDHQLAGAYGRGDIYYLQGPFEAGLKTQGYQEAAPALLYRQAIEDIGLWLRTQERAAFGDLPEPRQDDFLVRLSEGEIDLPNVDGATFFDMLWSNTQEGYFGDPVHGGNRDMAAWRMIGFPGARYDYRPYVKHGGAPLRLEPVSVAGFPQRSEE